MTEEEKIEDGKRVIADFLGRFSTKPWGNPDDPHDYDWILEPIADDCDWKMPTDLHGGRFDKEKFKAMLRAMQEVGAGYFIVTIDGWTCQGKRIAMQGHSHIPLKNGKAYENFYHHLFEVEDGKITKFWEYADMLRAVQAFDPAAFVADPSSIAKG